MAPEDLPYVFSGLGPPAEGSHCDSTEKEEKGDSAIKLILCRRCLGLKGLCTRLLRGLKYCISRLQVYREDESGRTATAHSTEHAGRPAGLSSLDIRYAV